MTAIWLNPVLENNMPDYSYHGYAMTDLYNVDSRHGSNEEYQQLCATAAQMGIGVIMDQVANHIGSHHPWMKDLPSEDWVNQWEEFTQTNHMKVSGLIRILQRLIKEFFSRRMVCFYHARLESAST